MKKPFKFLVLATVMLTFAVSAYSQTIQATSATAVIVAPITITKNSDLNFGTVMNSPAGGTVVITPAGVRSKTGTITLSSLAPAATAATFVINGTATYNYAISLTAAPITLTGSVSGTMTVDTWTYSVPLTGTFAGAVNFNVGATLNVGAAQAAGTYTGTFDVSVDYN